MPTPWMTRGNRISGRVIAGSMERPGPDRRAQQQGGDEGDQVRLEHVGGHARAVADIVPDVVGDGRRVARVVLGDGFFYFAHQIRADVRRLGEDAAADAHEQGGQAPAEAEADQHLHGVTAEDEEDDGRAQQPQPDRHHARHGPAAEGRLQRPLVGGQRLVGRPLVADDGHAHADVACRVGERDAEQEGNGHAEGDPQPVLAIIQDDQQDGQDRHQRQHRPHLLGEVRQRARPDRLSDLLHGGRAGRQALDLRAQDESIDQGDGGGQQDEPQDAVHRRREGGQTHPRAPRIRGAGAPQQ